jgi:CRISPR-associated protein Cmr6
MPLIVPLPESLRRHRDSCTHAGLLLDKFVKSYDPSGQETKKWQEAVQRPTALDVVRLSQRAPATFDFRALAQRWTSALSALSAVTFHGTTTGPLTLHLARASALENAGICLHPLYGFTYLPGSGLKGMARAYAETVWLLAHTDQRQAWRQIEDVFGWAPNPDRRQQINDPNHPAEVRRKDDNDPDSPEIKSSSGNIVFHDAWPESWPQLIVDIVNNHHPEYYQAAADDNDHPPGDWENPVPVYFLAVRPGTTFTFSLSKRRPHVSDELLALAHQWLLGALCHLGAGAKTIAGYGAFKPMNQAPPALSTQRRAAFETTLELITPAFLAGASQQKEDCDLRPATLRGQLRWWWRTMHAGFVDVKTLRALEAAIWGDTRASGAVRVVVEKFSGEEPRPYDKRSKANFNEQQKRSDHGIPNDDPRKTTQGLWYASYGMDEGGQVTRRRHYLEPGARWRLRLTGRPTQFFANREDAGDPNKANQGRPISAQQVLQQAQAALWLLCHFGGVGSKAGKGFGSLASTDLSNRTLSGLQSHAAELRLVLRLNNTFSDSAAGSASLQQMLDPIEVAFRWPSIWSVLDQAGFAYQTFAKKYKHKRDKMALGLPRRIGTRAQGAFNPRQPVTANARHTSPVRIHVERAETGWLIRAIGLPAANLPDLATSRKFLEEFLKDFADDLRSRAGLQPISSGPSQGSSPKVAASPPAQSAQTDKVTVKFLGPHDNLKNAFWVQEEGKKRGLLKYGTPRTPLPTVDSEIEVYRTNNNPNSPEYRWDSPPPPNPSRGGPGGQRPRGRR